MITNIVNCISSLLSVNLQRKFCFFGSVLLLLFLEYDVIDQTNERTFKCVTKMKNKMWCTFSCVHTKTNFYFIRNSKTLKHDKK